MEPRTTRQEDGSESVAGQREPAPALTSPPAAAASGVGTGRAVRSVTVQTIRQMKGSGQPVVMVTAYDTPGARAVDRAGADIILVGDSLGMVVLGHPDTLQVDMTDMVRHAAAVRRASPRALVVVDMPFLSYQVSPERAVENAGRLVREGGADAVKLEGGHNVMGAIEAILRASIPVMGHVGLTPQSVKAFGGYRVQGRSESQANAVAEEARAVADAGVFAMVLEGIPRELGRLITAAVPVPTIGIGAGPDTDGQVLVLHDLAGLSEGRLPRFVKRYAQLADDLERAVAEFVADVRTGAYPEATHWYE
jgi:3-methyl-2-oxobutanoate hydroxymethyltransferase